MQIEYYTHNKTGKLYSVVQWNFMFKDNDNTYRLTEDDRYWRKNLVLYKAEYENPDGPYFSRTIEDFKNSFTKVEDNENIKK